MANRVREIMTDIAYRIGDPEMDDTRPPVILRAMKRLYRSINAEYYPIKSSKTYVEADYSEHSLLGFYATKEPDIIEIYRCCEGTTADNTRDKDYVQDFKQYKKSLSRAFSVDGYQIYFSSINGDENITVWYYSMGKILVDKDDGDVTAETEVNTPEYPVDLQDVLVCGTAIRLKTDYPLFPIDVADFSEFKTQFSKRRYHKSSVTPSVVGGIQVRSARQAYGEG